MTTVVPSTPSYLAEAGCTTLGEETIHKMLSEIESGRKDNVRISQDLSFHL